MDKLTESTQNRQNRGGRPSKSQELAIKELLWSYYEKNFSAHFVAKLADMPNEKTIQKYFRRWTEERNKNYVKEQVQKDLDAKTALLDAIDGTIYSVLTQIQAYKKAILDHRHQYDKKTQLEVSGKEVSIYIPNSYLVGQFISLIKYHLELQKQRATIYASPTVEDEKITFEQIKNKFEKMIKK